MESALHIKTNVLPGHKVEITAPELKEGELVDVFLVISEKAGKTPSADGGTILDFLESLPPGPRSFKTWQDMELQLQRERDSWDC